MLPKNVQAVLGRINTIQKNFKSLVTTFNSLNTNSNSKKDETGKAKSFKQELNNAKIRNQTNGNKINTDNNGTNNKYPYSELIKKAAEKYGFKPELIRAVVKVESNFNPNAVSKAGAMGLMQIMPMNFKNLGIKHPFNPEESIMNGTKFLRDLYNKFNHDIKKTLAAYNAGPSRVAKHGIPASVKKNYVDKVLRYMQSYGGK